MYSNHTHLILILNRIDIPTWHPLKTTLKECWTTLCCVLFWETPHQNFHFFVSVYTYVCRYAIYHISYRMWVGILILMYGMSLLNTTYVGIRVRSADFFPSWKNQCKHKFSNSSHTELSESVSTSLVTLLEKLWKLVEHGQKLMHLHPDAPRSELFRASFPQIHFKRPSSCCSHFNHTRAK